MRKQKKNKQQGERQKGREGTKHGRALLIKRNFIPIFKKESIGIVKTKLSHSKVLSKGKLSVGFLRVISFGFYHKENGALISHSVIWP